MQYLRHGLSDAGDDFPDRDMIWKLEREHKIFKVVRQESKEKMAKQDALKARAAAEDAVAKLTTRVRFEVAGEFGEKRFLVQMEETIKENRMTSSTCNLTCRL